MKEYFVTLGLIIVGIALLFCAGMAMIGSFADIRNLWYGVPLLLLIPALPMITNWLSEPPKTKEDERNK